MTRAEAAGSVRREVLKKSDRAKLDPSSDAAFYAQPRFVTHVDDDFISKVTELYRRRVPRGAAVLDLCSSWVSHLPREVEYEKVWGPRDERDGAREEREVGWVLRAGL